LAKYYFSLSASEFISDLGCSLRVNFFSFIVYYRVLLLFLSVALPFACYFANKLILYGAALAVEMRIGGVVASGRLEGLVNDE